MSCGLCVDCWIIALVSCTWRNAAAQTTSAPEEIATCNANLLHLKSLPACGGQEMQHCRRTSSACADGCQDAIDLVYSTCSGLVMNLYRHESDWVSKDEGGSIEIDRMDTVDWDDEVEPAVKLAIESCGCTSSAVSTMERVRVWLKRVIATLGVLGSILAVCWNFLSTWCLELGGRERWLADKLKEHLGDVIDFADDFAESVAADFLKGKLELELLRLKRRTLHDHGCDRIVPVPLSMAGLVYV
eukprot:COSAG02_NODE_715_length_18086_cov_109.753433_14_plen_244_part_00